MSRRAFYRKYTEIVSLSITVLIGFFLGIILSKEVSIALFVALGFYYVIFWVKPLQQFIESLDSDSSIRPAWLCSAVGHLIILICICSYSVMEQIIASFKHDRYLWNEGFIISICFLVVSPLCVVILIIPCILFLKYQHIPEVTHSYSRRNHNRRNDVSRVRKAKLLKMFKGLSNIFKFKRRSQNNSSVETVCSPVDAECANTMEENDEESDEMTNLPSYEDLMLEGLPSYKTLKLKQVSVGRKLYVIDRKLHMISFANTTSV